MLQKRILEVQHLKVGIVLKTNETSEINFYEMMEAIPNGIAYARLVFDHLHEPRDFAFLGMNYAFEQVIGLDKEFLTGKNTLEINAQQNKEDLGLIYFLFRLVIIEGKYSAEFYSAQDEKWYQVTVVKFEKLFLAILLQDITEQKSLEVQVSEYQLHLKDLTGSSNSYTITLHDGHLDKESIKKLRYLTFHDKLTGLYNRAFFDEELARLDTVRQLPLSVIMGDVNGLKLTNDVFGHLVGDRLLKTMANILKKSFRDKEIIARWGGDEFSVLLPCTTYQDALKLVDRIKEKCDAAENNPLKPSIALGVSTKIDPTQDLFLVIKDAEERMYSNKLFEGKIVRRSIIDSLEKIVHKKNPVYMAHCTRVSLLCEKFGAYLHLTGAEQDALNKLSWFHDIGSVRVNKGVLKKSAVLSPKEWLEIRKHAEYGYRIAQLIPEINFIAELILSHHENWDGSGYPQKLKGREIPKLSRIFFLVDSYDVITHDRPFKAALSHEEAVDELKRRSGTQFDPNMTKDFINFINNCPQNRHE